MSDTRLTGAVRKLKQARGFGFIAGDDGNDYFFHWTGLRPSSEEKPNKNYRDLILQERVEFSLVPTDKGPRAVEIQTL